MGDELGGRPQGAEFYDANGKVRYDRLAASLAFETGIARLLEISDEQTLAMMCSEGDPAHCHRHFVIEPALRARGVDVQHILRDGSLGELL